MMMMMHTFRWKGDTIGQGGRVAWSLYHHSFYVLIRLSHWQGRRNLLVPYHSRRAENAMSRRSCLVEAFLASQIVVFATILH